MAQTAEVLSVSTGGFTLPASNVLTGRGFITGKSGSGKSNTASVVAEELLERDLPLLLIDTDGEYYGLRETYDLLLVGDGEECDLSIGPEEADRVAELALEEKVPIILDVSTFLEDEPAHELIFEVVKELFQAEKKIRMPFVIFVEEAHEFMPQGAGSDDLSKMLIRIAKRGRKRGLGICAMSQRPAAVDKDYITQCDWIVWHRLTWENDTAVASRILGAEESEPIETLDNGEAIVMTDWNEALQRVQFRRKRTMDAGSTPDLGDVRRASGDPSAIIEELSGRESTAVDPDDLPQEEARRVERLSGYDEIPSEDPTGADANSGPAGGSVQPDSSADGTGQLDSPAGESVRSDSNTSEPAQSDTDDGEPTPTATEAGGDEPDMEPADAPSASADASPAADTPSPASEAGEPATDAADPDRSQTARGADPAPAHQPADAPTPDAGRAPVDESADALEAGSRGGQTTQPTGAPTHDGASRGVVDHRPDQRRATQPSDPASAEALPSVADRSEAVQSVEHRPARADRPARPAAQPRPGAEDPAEDDPVWEVAYLIVHVYGVVLSAHARLLAWLERRIAGGLEWARNTAVGPAPPSRRRQARYARIARTLSVLLVVGGYLCLGWLLVVGF